ncbi:LysM peptidoglycan-binding domain-containing protein [Nocardioides cheoyonin]|uniref:LysM peptidoglycan-binding domain-containing protein n=1 Tax=Nocardioides cheoyonin TaxID=3156615 RepID=UPI0032B34E71
MVSRLLRGVAALVVLAALLVGAPLVLIAWLGNPWPPGGWAEVQLLTDRTLYGALAVIGWIAWAWMAGCIVVEALSTIRSIRVRGLAATIHRSTVDGQAGFSAGPPQQLARLLVTWVAALGIGASTVATAGAATAAATPGGHVDHTGTHAAPAAQAQPGENTAQRPSVTTSEPTTLWKLADTHLGDGGQWRQLLEANRGTTLSDGTTLASGTQTIPAGSTIHLPAGSRTPVKDVVEPGDSLSLIAQQDLGDANQWPALYEANKEVVGDNPDLIYPGQVLVIPGASPTPQGDRQPAPQTDPQVQDRAPRHRDDQPGHDSDAAPGTNGGAADPEQRRDGEEPDGAGHSQVPEPADPGTSTAPVIPIRPSQHEEAGTPDQESAATVEPSDSSEVGGISPLSALLATAGTFAVGMMGLFVYNRRRLMRQRPLGQTIASVPAAVADVEQEALEYGAEAQKDVVFLDRALRYVAASCKVAGSPLPQLGAAVLGEEDLTLLFTQPAAAQVPDGWEASDDARAWMLSRDTYLEDELDEQPAPYPALVSIGQGDSGHTWYLDLETLGTCGIAGGPDQVAGLTRFWVSELALNEWAKGCEVLVAEPFGAEMVALNPERVRQVDRAAALARAAAVTREVDEVEQNLDADLLTRRRDGLVLDSTNPVVVVVDSRPEGELAAGLEDRARCRVVVVHGEEESPAVELRADGTAYLPMWGISVEAFSMTKEQAELGGQVSATLRGLGYEPVPNTATDDGPLGKYARADGSLREEYTEPRHTEGGDPSSMLPEADEVYLAAGATTAEDLAALARSVPESTRAEIAALDPTLDEDLADWFDETCPRPKVHLLGPVDVRALNGGDPAAIGNRNMAVSLIAYLACQERGVTSERIASDFGWSTKKTAENRATDARNLLGKREDGSDWLPEAGASDSARRGGTPTYQLPYQAPGGVLSSAELFIRLRNRAERRGDAGGCEEDLVAALSLVTGTPFEGVPERRFPWLAKTQRHDLILRGTITDTAHILANRGVAAGRTDLVRTACAAARKANPDVDVAWLDEAAVKALEEGPEATDEMLRREVVDRYDEDLPERTETILDEKNWATG